MAGSTFFGFEVVVPIWLNVTIISALTVLAGIMAGLILCVFSLDANRLAAVAQSRNSREAHLAKRVLMIIDKPHWLLITLLLWDNLALEMMPLLLNMFLHPAAAISVSVGITLIFCEIIPQAIFIQNAFTVSAHLAPFIYVLMWLSAPIAWPLGKLLDMIVGDKEAVFFQRRELRELIRFQEELREKKRNETSDSDVAATGAATGDGDEADEDLTKEEVTIMLNVLSLSESTAAGMLQCPIEAMFTLHADSVITQATVDTIFNNGYTLVPVYEDTQDPTNITHVLLTKALLLLAYRDVNENVRVRDLPLMPMARFPGDTIGTEIFLTLQEMSPSLAAITDVKSGKVLGILTLRNIIELVHQTTFKAEFDPRNPSPMQLMMRSWKLYRRVGEYSMEVSSRPSNLDTNYIVYSAHPLKETSLRHSASNDRLSTSVQSHRDERGAEGRRCDADEANM